MPNFETGHYFLTVLAPVRTGARGGPEGYSYRQKLLEELARLPHSEATANSRGTAEQSPFARSRMTHLARFALIDDLPYNGRESGDTILGKLSGQDPLVQRQVDRLSTPFLLFAADFDAADGSDASLRAFTDALWRTMRPELTAILDNCHGFEGVATAGDFFHYVKRCQVETTMPFNDYYPEEPRHLQLPPDMPLPVEGIKAGARALIGLVALWLLCILLGAVLPGGWPRDAAAFVARCGLLVVPLLLAGAGLYLHRLYRKVMTQGPQPLPRSASLPKVLKSLYLQQHFVDFVIANQGAAPEELHAAFGRFLGAHAPDNLDAPTQAPGLIRLPGRNLPKGATA